MSAEIYEPVPEFEELADQHDFTLRALLSLISPKEFCLTEVHLRNLELHG
ncbi:MAG: hypothetical protein WAK31_22270 [Chthoniobacterales bacterium]